MIQTAFHIKLNGNEKITNRLTAYEPGVVGSNPAGRARIQPLTASRKPTPYHCVSFAAVAGVIRRTAAQIPVTALLNTEIYEHCPQIAAALRARKAEFVGHGRTNGERQRDLSEDAERALIERSCDLIARHEGTPPAGWLGPWLSETLVSGGESMGRALAILALRVGDERFPVNLHFGADAARLRQLIAANEEQLAMLERDDTGGHQRTQLTLRGFRPQPGARTRAGPSIRRRGDQRTASRSDRSDY